MIPAALISVHTSATPVYVAGTRSLTKEIQVGDEGVRVIQGKTEDALVRTVPDT